MLLSKVNYSDYGSGSSSSSSSWTSQQDIRWSSFPQPQAMEPTKQKSSSYSDLAIGRCTLDDVMREFQMNGSDSPYNPDEDRVWGKYPELSGMGPSGGYLRQKSWPAPEQSPAPPLPPAPCPSVPLRAEAVEFTTSTPVFEPAATPAARFAPSATLDALTAEQARVLGSLPSAVLHTLLRQLQADKRTKAFQFQECRFCKNNGERGAYYRSHVLKDGAGRVACPVLRAFVCARCGARGDTAHTIKYCPLSTNAERMKSAAMMRSVRMASGRRRALAPPVSAAADYVAYDEAPPAVLRDNNAYSAYTDAPLDPLWAALEQKLML